MPSRSSRLRGDAALPSGSPGLRGESNAFKEPQSEGRHSPILRELAMMEDTTSTLPSPSPQ